MIAGCMSQAKKILESYDEILYGPPPEELVETTHKGISDLLKSEDAKTLFMGSDGALDNSGPEQDLFIKRIVEAVSPIIPVAIRNKSLDGAYFRTALHLLGAAELLFSQYESDIRSQASPAGFVGMCNAMHAEFKRSTVHNNGLKPLNDFMKDMKGQYNTSLGLGEAFRNDSPERNKRRERKFSNPRFRTWNQSARFDDRSTPGGAAFRFAPARSECLL